MSTKSLTAREEACGRPCVVIDRDEHGNDFIHADPGVVVFSRCEYLADDHLYRYTPSPIPEGWLERQAGHKADYSMAEAKALAFGEAAPFTQPDQTEQDE